MPIDRAATLRTAEKLLRQGKLDAAIAEYARVVEDQPRDWATANMLGDLYVRARQTDKAVQQFTRIADHLNEEGFLPKAIAVYKKVLKLKSEDEHALLQSAEIASTQGLLADARAFLNTLAEVRQGRGDKRGAAQARIRLGSLDAGDFEGRSVAARARLEIGDAAGAVDDFKSIAADLVEKGREADALHALREAAQIDPQDQDVRERLLQAYLTGADFQHAREFASTADHFKRLAAALEAAAKADDALAALREAARIDPADVQLRTHLARAFVAKGDVAAAAEYLTEETAGEDPALLLMVAEIQLRAGRTNEGLAIVRRLLEQDPSRREQIALLSWQIAAQAPDAAFLLAEAAADASIAAADWAAAAAALQELVTRVPNHLAALMRLVEICVDGGLEATLYSAQVQLADAYLASGSAAEARVIAEDLVAREPWERGNIERFRKALVMQGEQDPDAMIAERLSGQSPFTSTDLSIDFSDIPFEPDEPAAAASKQTPATTTIATPPAAAPKPAPAPTADKPQKPAAPRGFDAGKQFGLGANSIDLGSILRDLESDSTAPASGREVDLSVVLDDIKPQAHPGASSPAGEIEDVFARMRDEASRKSAIGAAEEQLKRGLALKESGRVDESIAELEAASRAPRFRFAAASVLGRIHLQRGQKAAAVEWLERAAQAPAPTPGDYHQLLYDLADALESEGETARALAVCLELQADAGTYRDVATRVDRLARVQTRG